MAYCLHTRLVNAILVPMKDVLYARAAPALKAAVDGYAEQRAISINAAIVDLVTKGLAASEGEEFSRTRLATLDDEHARLKADLAESQSQLRTLTAFIERVQLNVGVCTAPNCGHGVTGLDLLSTGKCPRCGTALISLPTTTTTTTKPFDGQLLLLLGAVGLLVGAAWAASKS